MDFFRIISDSSVFHISKKTLIANPQFIISRKVINNIPLPTNGIVCEIDNNTFIIDAPPTYVEELINKLRKNAYKGKLSDMLFPQNTSDIGNNVGNNMGYNADVDTNIDTNTNVDDDQMATLDNLINMFGNRNITETEMTKLNDADIDTDIETNIETNTSAFSNINTVSDKNTFDEIDNIINNNGSFYIDYDTYYGNNDDQIIESIETDNTEEDTENENHDLLRTTDQANSFLDYLAKMIDDNEKKSISISTHLISTNSVNDKDDMNSTNSNIKENIQESIRVAPKKNRRNYIFRPRKIEIYTDEKI